ncbi:hypothetical protein O7632_28155 [Solwaraspora sp. WMMD406]|uniref:hypothetical protein n=1 Tax=Solwaraspora sp. WMMD406 TaxID=3016095 RepID=UPI002416A133|nr:hypothetical protein [Solwaraspora sp. WMMD406]MDG4767937.1 hypothetical protein [Solwaraspora sp. WMMD406]
MVPDTALSGVGVLVAGMVASPACLARRGSASFGREAPGWPIVPYALQIGTERLCDLIEPVYERFLRDALIDAQHFPHDWPELVAVIDAECPPLARLPAELPDYLAEIMCGPLASDVLEALLPPDDAAPARYLANTVDYVRVDPAWTTLCGRAVQRPG